MEFATVDQWKANIPHLWIEFHIPHLWIEYHIYGYFLKKSNIMDWIQGKLAISTNSAFPLQTPLMSFLR